MEHNNSNNNINNNRKSLERKGKQQPQHPPQPAASQGAHVVNLKLSFGTHDTNRDKEQSTSGTKKKHVAAAPVKVHHQQNAAVQQEPKKETPVPHAPKVPVVTKQPSFHENAFAAGLEVQDESAVTRTRIIEEMYRIEERRRQLPLEERQKLFQLAIAMDAPKLARKLVIENAHNVEDAAEDGSFLTVNFDNDATLVTNRVSNHRANLNMSVNGDEKRSKPTGTNSRNNDDDEEDDADNKFCKAFDEVERIRKRLLDRANGVAPVNRGDRAEAEAVDGDSIGDTSEGGGVGHSSSSNREGHGASGKIYDYDPFNTSFNSHSSYGHSNKDHNHNNINYNQKKTMWGGGGGERKELPAQKALAFPLVRSSSDDSQESNSSHGSSLMRNMLQGGPSSSHNASSSSSSSNLQLRRSKQSADVTGSIQSSSTSSTLTQQPQPPPLQLQPRSLSQQQQQQEESDSHTARRRQIACSIDSLFDSRPSSASPRNNSSNSINNRPSSSPAASLRNVNNNKQNQAFFDPFLYPKDDILKQEGSEGKLDDVQNHLSFIKRQRSGNTLLPSFGGETPLIHPDGSFSFGGESGGAESDPYLDDGTNRSAARREKQNSSTGTSSSTQQQQQQQQRKQKPRQALLAPEAFPRGIGGGGGGGEDDYQHGLQDEFKSSAAAAAAAAVLPTPASSSVFASDEAGEGLGRKKAGAYSSSSSSSSTSGGGPSNSAASPEKNNSLSATHNSSGNGSSKNSSKNGNRHSRKNSSGGGSAKHLEQLNNAKLLLSNPLSEWMNIGKSLENDQLLSPQEVHPYNTRPDSQSEVYTASRRGRGQGGYGRRERVEASSGAGDSTIDTNSSDSSVERVPTRTKGVIYSPEERLKMHSEQQQQQQQQRDHNSLLLHSTADGLPVSPNASFRTKQEYESGDVLSPNFMHRKGISFVSDDVSSSNTSSLERNCSNNNSNTQTEGGAGTITGGTTAYSPLELATRSRRHLGQEERNNSEKLDMIRSITDQSSMRNIKKVLLNLNGSLAHFEGRQESGEAIQKQSSKYGSLVLSGDDSSRAAPHSRPPQISPRKSVAAASVVAVSSYKSSSSSSSGSTADSDNNLALLTAALMKPVVSVNLMTNPKMNLNDKDDATPLLAGTGSTPNIGDSTSTVLGGGGSGRLGLLTPGNSNSNMNNKNPLIRGTSASSSSLLDVLGGGADMTAAAVATKLTKEKSRSRMREGRGASNSKLDISSSTEGGSARSRAATAVTGDSIVSSAPGVDNTSSSTVKSNNVNTGTAILSSAQSNRMQALAAAMDAGDAVGKLMADMMVGNSGNAAATLANSNRKEP